MPTRTPTTFGATRPASVGIAICPRNCCSSYRYIREFYFAGGARLDGVVLVGDFPAAGICTFNDIPGVPGGRGELDYFCVDAMLADPFGYWEWQPLAPMVPPGSPQVLRLPYDEGSPPNFAFYPRTQWSAPGFVLMRQSEVHHSQRDPIVTAPTRNIG